MNPFAYNWQGQCTWYAYGRMLETGLLPATIKNNALFRGHAGTWKNDALKVDLPVTSTPTPGARGLVVWPPNTQWAGSVGHVAFLEEVYPDGRVRITESNWPTGSGIKERILTPAQYAGLSFVQLENAQTNSYNAPPATPGQQRQYIVRSGDTLSGIAQRELGDANRWREIQKPGGGTFTDAEARNLQVGQSVYLPVSYQSGSGVPVTQQPSSTPGVNGNIQWVNFSGTVGPPIGVNLRNSTRFSDRSSRNEPNGKRLEFDAWTYGEVGTDMWNGNQDARWFKVKGTNLWVPSAYIYGNPPNSTPMPGGSSGSNSGGGSQSVVQALRTAIIGQESGYNYKAVNPDSGALGFAQIMPFNIGPWSREALGYEITRAQFLNSPDLQLKIIDYKLNQYYQNAIAASGGNMDIAVRRVASAWYSGDPNLYANTRPQYYNGNQYPSIADYTLSVLGKFRQAYGSGSANNSNNSNNSNSSNNAGLNLVNFTGSVMPPIGVARRNSPNFSDKNGKADPYGKVLSFDAWRYGETGTDYQLGTPDARWFRIAGTNEWVPSAYINGNPPNSSPMPGGGAVGNVTIGVTPIDDPATDEPKQQPVEKPSHSDYEKLVWAIYDYRSNDPQKRSKAEQDIADLGYEVAPEGIFDDNSGTGFFALGLTSKTKPPVLVIRGTEPTGTEDIIADLDPRGIGFMQFEANKDKVQAWLTKQSSPVDVTGHSLGGALAQWFGASYANQVQEVVTFNAPGIPKNVVSKFSSNPNATATHYIVSGDVVSMAGQAYLPGSVKFIKYDDTKFPDFIDPTSEHLIGATTKLIPLIYPIAAVTPALKDLSLNSQMTVDELSSPTFMYLDNDYFSFLLTLAGVSGLANLLSLIPALQGVGVSASKFLLELTVSLSTRLTTELARLKHGPVIVAVLKALDVAWEALTGPVKAAIEAAWNAAKNWSTAAWSAITKWTADAWNATTKWTADTWNATTQWTADTWNTTTQWTSEMWNKTATAVGDALTNIGNFFSSFTLPNISWPWN